MEHSLPSLELVRPWRRATIVASAVAVLELVLLVVLTVALVGRPLAERIEAAGERAAEAAPAAPAPSASAAAGQAEVLARSETAVLVLNGNGRAGAAGRTAEQVKATGYILVGVGNAPRADYQRTLVMYRPGKKAEAERLATDLGAGLVAPLDGLRLSELMGAHAVLILGR